MFPIELARWGGDPDSEPGSSPPHNRGIQRTTNPLPHPFAVSSPKRVGYRGARSTCICSCRSSCFAFEKLEGNNPLISLLQLPVLSDTSAHPQVPRMSTRNALVISPGAVRSASSAKSHRSLLAPRHQIPLLPHMETIETSAPPGPHFPKKTPSHSSQPPLPNAVLLETTHASTLKTTTALSSFTHPRILTAQTLEEIPILFQQIEQALSGRPPRSKAS